MSVWEGRKRLDATLSSSALKDTASIFEITRNHLKKSPPFDVSVQSIEDWVNKDVDQEAKKHSFEAVKFLEVLRSAGGDKTGELSLSDEAEDSSRGWKLKEENAFMRVMYRKGPEGTPFHTYCVEGTIDGPMVNALCVSWEAPSYKDWWPQVAVPSFKVVESRWLQRIRVGEDVSLIRVKVPWPLANREVLMTAFELEYLEEDLILVILGTASSSSQVDVLTSGLSYKDLPLDQKNVVRMDIAGGYVLQKMTPNKSYFRTVLDVDIKLDFVPPWLINFISRQLVGLGYKLYQKAVLSANTGKGSSKLLMEKEPLYNRLKGLSSSHASSQIASRMPLLLDGEGLTSFVEKNKNKALQGDEEIITSASHDMVPSIQGQGMLSNEIVTGPPHLSAQGKVNIQPGSPAKKSLDPTGQVSVRAENESCEAIQVDEFRHPEVRKALDALDKMIALVRSLTTGVESGRIIFTGKYENRPPSAQFASSFSSGGAVVGNHNLKPLENPKMINVGTAMEQNGLMIGHASDVRNDIAVDSVGNPELGICNKKKQLPKQQWLSCFKF